MFNFIKFLQGRTQIQGIIGYYDLTIWYHSLSPNEKELLKWSNMQGLGFGIGDNDENTLLKGEYSSSQTKLGWLNVMGSNIISKDLNFAIKIFELALNEEAKTNDVLIDRYFALGNISKALYKLEKYEISLIYSIQQLDWYRNNENRKIFVDRFQRLPKSIAGLEVAIDIYKKQKSFNKILCLLKEFSSLVDSEAEYKFLIHKYEALYLRHLGEIACQNKDIKKAIEYFEKALSIDSKVGVKQFLKKLNSEQER